MRSILVALLVAGLLAAPAGAHEGEEHRKATPLPVPPARFEPPPPGSYELPPIQRVGEHRLIDSRGREQRLPELAPGQLAVVSFIYLSCGHACPRATAVMQQLDHRLAERPEVGERVRLVSVSFDPERDTPEAMARQRAALAPRGDWRFLTAPNAASLAPVLEDWGQDLAPEIAADGDPTGRLQHVLRVFLVDSEGDVRNVYSTGFLDLRLLWNDLLTLAQEG